MLKEKFEQAKTFVAEHKKEIGVSVLIIAGGAISYKIVRGVMKTETLVDMIETHTNRVDLDIPKLELGKIDDLWSDEWGTNLILNDVTVGDLGKVGEEFLKIGGVTNETVVTAVVGLLDKVEEVKEF